MMWRHVVFLCSPLAVADVLLLVVWLQQQAQAEAQRLQRVHERHHVAALPRAHALTRRAPVYASYTKALRTLRVCCARRHSLASVAALASSTSAVGTQKTSSGHSARLRSTAMPMDAHSFPSSLEERGEEAVRHGGSPCARARRRPRARSAMVGVGMRVRACRAVHGVARC